MKKLSLLLIFVLFCVSTLAYRAGDTVTYRVVCHYDNGTVDTGCTKPAQERVYLPDGTVKQCNNLSEIDEANAPGLWAGNFTIPAGTSDGIIGVFITLINSNFTQAATVLSYSVEKLATETNITTIMENATPAQTDISTILANTITLSTEHSTLEEGIQTNATDIKTLLVLVNQSIKDNITSATTDIVSDIETYGDAAWITATGFQTETNALTRYGNILLNFSDVLNNLTGIFGNITSATSDLRTRGDAAWITATGFQTETNALTRYGNLLYNFSDTLNNLTGIYGNITSATSDLRTRGDAAWITATGFQTEANALTRYGNILLNFSTVVGNLSVMSTDALTRFTSLSDGIQKNATAVSANVTDEVDAISVTASVSETDKRQIAEYLLNRTIANTSLTLNETLGELWINLSTISTDALTRFTSLSAGIQDNASDIKTLLVLVNQSIKDNITSATTDIVSDIETYGDAAWITATGFQTEANALTRYGNLLLNFSDVKNNITDVLGNLSVMSTIAGTRFTSLSAGIQDNASDIKTLLVLVNQSIKDNITSATTDIVSDIETYGDAAWITATGFQTEANALTRYGNILLNFSDVLNNLTGIFGNITSATSDLRTRGDAAWITATGFQTEANALTRYGNLLLNFSDVINNLSVMSTDALIRFISLSDGIQKNATAISVNISQIPNAVWNESRTSYRTTGTFGNLMRKIKTALHIIE